MVVQKKMTQSLRQDNFATYVTESCGLSKIFRQTGNVYLTKASVWIRQLSIFLFCSWQVNYSKTAFKTSSWIVIETRFAPSPFSRIKRNGAQRRRPQERTTDHSRLDQRSMADSTSSWLIVSQALFKTCFTWTFSIFWRRQNRLSSVVRSCGGHTERRFS